MFNDPLRLRRKDPSVKLKMTSLGRFPETSLGPSSLSSMNVGDFDTCVSTSDVSINPWDHHCHSSRVYRYVFPFCINSPYFILPEIHFTSWRTWGHQNMVTWKKKRSTYDVGNIQRFIDRLFHLDRSLYSFVPHDQPYPIYLRSVHHDPKMVTIRHRTKNRCSYTKIWYNLMYLS